MLDLKFIVENPKLVQEGCDKKQVAIDISKILKLDEERRKHIKDIDELRTKQNQVSKEIPQKKESEKEQLLKEMKALKDNLKMKEQSFVDLEEKLDELVLQVPNPPFEEVPVGETEQSNKIIRAHGKPTKFDFEPKDHVTLGKELDILDLEKAAQASGKRFYYVKNDLVLLEFALIQYAFSKILPKGFKPILPPLLVKEHTLLGTGFFPAERNEIYSVNPGEDDLFLVGTSEAPLCMLHYDEILNAKDLPLRYLGFSTCFRREAGSYGKDTHGIIRVHQFNKIEMFSFVHPDESKKEHNLILEIEEDIIKGLGMPYQVNHICTGDLGAPAAQKFDIEVWIPTQGKYRELTSCSNTTDFQARRSKIRYKNERGKNEYIHTVNGTGIAMSRMFVAIMENFQNKDGSIEIPEVLRPYMGNKEKIEQSK